MASKTVVRTPHPRKPPRVVGAFPSKLLHDCARCGRPTFLCRFAGKTWPVAVEVLETPVGDIAIQAQLGGDELTAIVVASPRTWYRLHAPYCMRAASFVGAAPARKVRP